MSRSMTEQMAHNMGMRGEGGGVIENKGGERTIAEQMAHNEQMRGGPKPPIINEDDQGTEQIDSDE